MDLVGWQANHKGRNDVARNKSKCIKLARGLIKLNSAHPKKKIKLESDQASRIRSNYQFIANTED